MNFSRKLALLSLVLAGSIGMTGCKSNAKMPVNFVAVTSSDYNATVQFGDYDYKFQGKIIQGSNKFTLAANVQQRHNDAQSSQRMGPPSGGGGSDAEFVGFGAEQGGQQGGGQQGGGFGGGDFGGGGFGGGDFGGGAGAGAGEAQTVAIEGLTLTLPKAEVFINEAITPTVTFSPANVSRDDQGVEWSTSAKEVATVTESGVISPNGAGTVTITATSKKDPTKSASAQLTVKEEPNLEQYNWMVEAEYKYQKGYGYVLSFKDEGKTEIHTDFDRTEGRHEFYYNVKINNVSKTVKFQAKDPTFKDSLAKDYKKWDERDSTYIFYAKATGNNNSVATAYMYLHGSDHSVVVNTPSGSERELTFGLTWSETGEGANKQIVVKDGQKEFKADVSIEATHPGYRLVYGGNAYYLSLDANVKWKKLAKVDFDGQTDYEFAGSYSASMFGDPTEVNLDLGKDGVSRLYVGNPAPSFKGTWSKDATTGKVSVTINGQTGEFEQGLDGKLSIIARLSVSSMNMFTGTTETKTYSVTLSQSKPAANA